MQAQAMRNKEAGVAGKQDIKAAEATYGRFMAMFKWGSVVVAIITAFVIWLIAG